MASSFIWRSRWDRIFFALWICVMLWLVVSALTNQGETGDGYQSIVNMRFLLGDVDFWYVQRGPLMTLLLLPAEWLGKLLYLHPLDLRLIHLWVVCLHGLYLLFVWAMLRRIFPKNGAAVFFVFLGTILCMVFVGYAMLISPDILPGSLGLAMVLLFRDWLDEKKSNKLVSMTIIGFLLPFFKPTYSIFWIAIYVYSCVACIASRIEFGRPFFKLVSFNDFLKLTVFGALSAVICWVGYAVHVALSNYMGPFWLGPLEFIGVIWRQIPQDYKSIYFPWYMYIVNVHNFGFATLFFVFCFLSRVRFNSLRRERGLCELRQELWRNSFLYCFIFCFCLLVLSLLSFREVRYLLVLVPLLALIIIPTVHKVLHARNKWRMAKWFAVSLLCVDLMRVIPFVAAQLSLASNVNISAFLRPMESRVPLQQKVFISYIINFVVFDKSPILGDRYHGLYHLTAELIHRLYREKFWVHGKIRGAMFSYDQVGVGDAVLLSDRNVVRLPNWWEATKPNLEGFTQFSGVVRELEVTLHGDFFSYDKSLGPHVILSPGADGLFMSFDGTFSKKGLIEWGLVKEGDQSAKLKAVRIQVLCPQGLCREVR